MPDPLRLLSMPPRHAYVDAVAPVGTVAVRPGRVRGFEPDPLFVPGAVSELAGEADVVHLHFGFDHLDAAAARHWCDELGAAGLPLVLTVHDLRNPHHATPVAHDAVLDVLVPRAAAVLTLTPGAAAEIGRRWGRDALVVPHPSLADPARTDGVATEAGLVTLHLKSLRTNLIDPLAVVTAAAAGARAGGGRLRVDVHDDVVDDPRLRGLDVTDAEVVVHGRYDDLALERYLRRAQVTVLPHRWGTHSGWLELARDLGTRVVAPSSGHYADQWSEVVTYVNDEDHGLDAASLQHAVARAVRLPVLEPAPRAGREAEAAFVREVHARVFADVTASRSTRVPA